MNRLIALFLLICMLFGFCACSAPAPDTSSKDNEELENNEITENTPPTIAVPEYKDYGRGTVDYDNIVYRRPDLQSVIDAIAAVTQTVTSNEKPIEDQIGDIRSLEEPLSTSETMYSLAEINRSKDSSDEFWHKEYEYISTNYPRVTQAVEDLLVACAISEHKDMFEDDYFGYSLDEYVDGGIYTDEVVALMEEESRLESEYSSLSTSNVEIVYDSVDSSIFWEGTVDEVITMAREHFKDNDASYERVLVAINLLYENKRTELEKPIYVELVKVRRLIADALGYESYSELAYESMGYDYTESDMLALLSDVGQYASPVASDLEYTVFGGYFQNHVQPILDDVVLMNNLYEVYSELGGNYKDAYSYMLQHKLYDVKKSTDNRFDGAFTTYLQSNNSPYLFISSSGFLRDYLTLSHEFGHFLDGYINYGNDESLAVCEISSQALELLTVLKLKEKIHSADYQYLEYYAMFTFLGSVLLTQSFYAAFEHEIYSLAYDEITEERLEEAVEDAFSAIFGEDMTIEGDLSYVIMPHTLLYPFYVESYVTSGLVSLDIFFYESYRTGNAGDGFELYEALLNRDGSTLEFAERLEYAGLDSPFADGKVKEIANDIYFQIIGEYYYTVGDNLTNAA